MANRRCLQTIFRRYNPRISHTQNPFVHPISKIPCTQFDTLQNINPTESSISISPTFLSSFTSFSRHFCSNNHRSDDEDEEDDDDDDDEESDAEVSEAADDKSGHVSGKTDEEKAKEAEAIGYKVVSPLQEADRVFKTYEPVFAVVQVGSHQFKVSNGDSIFVEKLKYCDVNDKLVLNRVLLLGSKTQTIIGRPILPDAAVHAVVEEHALDAKVIIFKKKRRKNYRRTKGHRQELTKLRITDIQGIDKPEDVPITKTKKKAAEKLEVSDIQANKDAWFSTILRTEKIAAKMVEKTELSA